ncbi:Transmembrane domain-containing protein [Cedratvirus Zaza IHUMI]|uniref:Transmembrane domain-containing protein n=1 Tax=Cedratvirus Zaza IHUMI TaxID=2126979 RepID=A0A2R8FDA0_9VIRU|nr:Transmembrane domain-containing protein [Cedratvirus Zaza IHUMI]
MYIFIFIVLVQQALCLLLLNNRGYQGLEMLYDIIRLSFYTICAALVICSATLLLLFSILPLFP